MATRSLTDTFIFLRNRAFQNRHIFTDQNTDDRTALVNRDEEIELGNDSLYLNGHVPKLYVNKIEEIRFDVNRLDEKIKTIIQNYNRQLSRPTLDSYEDSEKLIEKQANEISQIFHRCQNFVHKLSSESRTTKGKDSVVLQNLSSSFARTIQDLSYKFKTAQSSYLRSLQGQENRWNQYNENNIFETDPQRNSLNLSQMQLVDDNTAEVLHREEEVLNIVRSIQDLNDIFKDLATLIVDQGSILDRIDYNVESSSLNVEQGVKQLQKASKRQKSNRKMKFILLLSGLIVVLIIVLVAIKS